MHDLVGEVAAEAHHRPAEDTTEGQRYTDTGSRSGAGLPEVGTQDVQLEGRPPHQEHVEHQTELADDIDDREVGVHDRRRADGQLGGGEEPLLGGRPDPAQKNRRAEQEPSHHDRDNLYLGEPAEQRPQQAIRQQDDRDLQEEVVRDRQQRRHGVSPPCPTSGTRTGRPSDRRCSRRPAPGRCARAPSCLPVRRPPSARATAPSETPPAPSI